MLVQRLGSKKIILATILVIFFIVVGILLHLRNVHKAQHTSGTIPTSQKTGPSASSNGKSQKVQTGSSGQQPNTKEQGSSVTDTAELVAPYGSFVSNHKPGQNGSPTSEQSVCNSTPGATCDIQFTDPSGVLKDLGAQVVGSDGTAYWSWDVSGGTLGPGSWQITAVVKLNGQTKTATDPTPLEVQ